MSIAKAGEPLIHIYFVDKWKELKVLVTLHSKDVNSN